MRKTMVALGGMLACIIGSFAEGIYDFKLGGERPDAQIFLASKLGASYVIEAADSVNGPWRIASGEEPVRASDFLSSGTVEAKGVSGFFRVNEVDADGPVVDFVSPTHDTIAVSPDSSIVITLSDVSDIDVSSIRLYINGEQIGTAYYSYEGGTLTYTAPSGRLGEDGQEISIQVSCADKWGNETSALSTITLARPLKMVAKSVLYVGSTDDGNTTYEIAGGVRKEKTSIVLTNTETDGLTFGGASKDDFVIGQVIVSLSSNNYFFRKVTGVGELDAGRVKVTTIDADLSDVFDGSFVSTSVAANSSAKNALKAAPLRMNIDTGGIVPIADYDMSIGKELGREFADAGFSLTPELNVRILGAYFAKGDVKVFGSSDYEIFFEGQIILSPSLTLTLTKTLSGWEKKKELPLAVIPIMTPVGPIGSFVPKLTGTLSIDANVLASLSAGASLGLNCCLHVSRKNGEWVKHPDNFCQTLIGGEAKLEVGGGYSAQLKFGVQMDVRIANVVGPYVFVGPYVEGSVTETKDLFSGAFTLSKRVTAGIEGSVGIYKALGKDWELAHDKDYIVLFDNSEQKYAPKFLTFPEDQTVDVGSQVVLAPSVVGDNPIYYCWQKNGVDIRHYEKNLSFRATRDSVGRYSCVARNSFGEVRNSMTISVTQAVGMEEFVGTWRQRATATDVREFHITNTGGGYFQLIHDGRPCHPTGKYPLTCTMHENGELRLSRNNEIAGGPGASPTVYYVRLTGDGVGRLRKANGDNVGNTTLIKRVSYMP